MYLFLVADMYPNRGFGDPKMDTSEGKSLWAELIFCVALFGLSLRVSMSRSRRADLYRKLDEVGYFGFAIVMGLLVGINIANFALVTRLFPAGRLLSPPRQFVSVFDWLLFYFWQFLHTIPDFEVTEVMHWAIPLNYTDRRIGLVVLVFKAFVILPILTTAVGYWNFRQARVSESVRRGLLEVILDRALTGSPRKRRQREDGVLGRAKRRYVRRNAAESADPTLPAEGGSPGEGTG